MDSEVARTLAELERKLQELELALSSATAPSEQPPQASPASGAPPAPIASSPPSAGDVSQSGARLVDEGLQGAATTVAPPSAPVPTPPAAPGLAPFPTADETLSVTPAPAPEEVSDESIELAELARFRDRLEQMTRELVEDYERVIRLRRPGQAHTPTGEA